MKKAYAQGDAEYRLLCEENEKGECSYGVEVCETVNDGVIKSAVKDICRDLRLALCLTFYLFAESVDACQLSDVIEDMLPVEVSTPEALCFLCEQIKCVAL